MTIEEACVSLKLECAIRDLGFIELGYRVVAHAGLFFVVPVSYIVEPHPYDEVLGFQLQQTYTSELGLRLGSPLAYSAKSAIELAFEKSLTS